MRTGIFVAAVGAMVLPAPAIAQPQPGKPSADFQKCMDGRDAAKGNRTAVETCIGTEMAVQEDRRDDAYHQAMTLGGVADQLRLRQDERDWRAGLSSACASQAGVERGGNINLVRYERCMLELTIARADWLQAYTPAVSQ